MNYCVFGRLKIPLSNRKLTKIIELWKKAEREWEEIHREILRKALSWKARCMIIMQKQGHQIKYLQKLFFYTLNIKKTVQKLL